MKRFIQLLLAALLITSSISTPVFAATSGDVVVNEFQANPDPSSPPIVGVFIELTQEWIELHNTTVNPIDLAGWTLGNGTQNHTFGALVIPANGFVVVCRSGLASPAIGCDDTWVWDVPGPLNGGLGNGGGTIVLNDDLPATPLIDSVTYAAADVNAGEATQVLTDANGNKVLLPDDQNSYNAFNTGTPGEGNEDNPPVPTTVVVNPVNEQGWSGILAGTSGGHDYVSGPATPPLGDGSVELSATGTCIVIFPFPGPCGPPFGIITTSDYRYGTGGFGGTALADILALSYQSNRATGDSGSPVLGMDIDGDVTDDIENGTGKIFFDPILNLVDNIWQNWNTLSNDSPFWYATDLESSCNVVTKCTFENLRLSLPSEAGISTIGRLFFQAYSSGATTTIFNIDSLNVATNTFNVLFDFEPAPPVVTTPPATTTSTTTTTPGSGGGNAVVQNDQAGPFNPETPAVEAEKTGQDTSSTNTGDDTPQTEDKQDTKKDDFLSKNWWWLLLILAAAIAAWWYAKKRAEEE